LRFKEVLLTWKTILVGIIFFLSPMCLYNSTAQNNFYPFSTMEEQLPNWQPWEMKQGPRVEALVLPVSDESNDDFNLKIIPGNLRKEPEFDIPIVINGKVEQYIHYFQTTIRHKFITWLSRSE